VCRNWLTAHGVCLLLRALNARVAHGRTPARRASFDVALFVGLFLEREVSENGETLCNDRIVEISPAEEGASP
jgi:hypothetical protein